MEIQKQTSSYLPVTRSIAVEDQPGSLVVGVEIPHNTWQGLLLHQVLLQLKAPEDSEVLSPLLCPPFSLVHGRWNNQSSMLTNGLHCPRAHYRRQNIPNWMRPNTNTGLNSKHKLTNPVQKSYAQETVSYDGTIINGKTSIAFISKRTCWPLITCKTAGVLQYSKSELRHWLFRWVQKSMYLISPVLEVISHVKVRRRYGNFIWEERYFVCVHLCVWGWGLVGGGVGGWGLGELDQYYLRTLVWLSCLKRIWII